jgi:hypothetical protein
MKIDFSAVIKDLDGDAVKEARKTPLWAAWPARRCCDDEQNLPAEHKVKRSPRKVASRR